MYQTQNPQLMTVLEKVFLFCGAVKIVGDEKPAVTEVAAGGDDVIIG